MNYIEACKDLALKPKGSYKLTYDHINAMRIATFLHLQQYVEEKIGDDFVYDYKKIEYHLGNVAFTASLIASLNEIDIRRIDSKRIKLINLNENLPDSWETYFLKSLVLIHDIRNCIRHQNYKSEYGQFIITNNKKYQYLNGKVIPVWMLDFIDSYTLPSQEQEFFYNGLKVLMSDINNNTNEFSSYVKKNKFIKSKKKIKLYPHVEKRDTVFKLDTRLLDKATQCSPFHNELLFYDYYWAAEIKYEENMKNIYDMDDSIAYINLYLMHLLMGVQDDSNLHYENIDLSIVDMIETTSDAKAKAKQVFDYYNKILLPRMKEEIDNAMLNKHIVYIINAYNNIQKYMRLYNKEKIRVISNSNFHNRTYLNGNYVVFKDSTKKHNGSHLVSVEKENLEDLCNSFENLYQEDCSLRTMFDNLYVMFRDADESEKLEDRERNAMEKNLNLSRYFELVYANYTGKKLDYNESFKNQFEGLMPVSKKSKK